MARRGRKPESQAMYEAKRLLREEYNRLKARINRIRDTYGTPSYDSETGKYGTTPAVETFYDKGLDKFSTKDKTLEELGKMKEDIDYVSSLRTSYVKGAENYNKYVAEWINMYDEDRPTYDRLMTLYNRMVEENAITEKFKYQIMEEIITAMQNEEHTDYEITEIIRNKLKEIYEEQEVSISGGTSYATKGKV